MRFEIDTNKLVEVANELQATEKEFSRALRRASQRTAATLRRIAASRLRTELEVRRVNYIRKRIKAVRFPSGSMNAGIWFGLNDLPSTYFNGTPRRVEGGASLQGQTVSGAFVGKSKYKNGQKAILKRKGKSRLPIEEQGLSIEKKSEKFIEKRIMLEIDAIFYKNFVQDIKARVRYLR